MSQSPPAPFLRDPITVPRKELIEHYRAQATRYQQLAERQQKSSVYEGLLGLARQCAAMADALAAHNAGPSPKPQLSEDEVLLLLNRVVAETEKTSGPPAQPATTRPLPPPLTGVARELSLDEILQKVEHDIAAGKPATA